MRRSALPKSLYEPESSSRNYSRRAISIATSFQSPCDGPRNAHCLFHSSRCLLLMTLAIRLMAMSLDKLKPTMAEIGCTEVPSER